MFGAQDKTGWFIVVAALHSDHHQSTEQIVLAAAESHTYLLSRTLTDYAFTHNTLVISLFG